MIEDPINIVRERTEHIIKILIFLVFAFFIILEVKSGIAIQKYPGSRNRYPVDTIRKLKMIMAVFLIYLGKALIITIACTIIAIIVNWGFGVLKWGI